MVSLIIYIVVEALVLTVGIGFGMDFVLSEQPGSSINWPVITGCTVIGLLLGLLFAWLVTQIFLRPPKTFWLWVYTFISGWFIGGLSFYLRAGSTNNPWQVTGMATTFGTLPGLFIGIFLSWKAASRQTIMTIADDVDYNDRDSTTLNAKSNYDNLFNAQEKEIVLKPELSTTSVLINDPRLERLQQFLYQELVTLETIFDGTEGQLLKLENQLAAITFEVPLHSGSLIFYIVFNTQYPHHAPESVMLELLDFESSLSSKFNYNDQVLHSWRKGNSLETIVKDGISQVEEVLIA